DSMPDDIWQALQQQQIDIITFASSKTVQYFCQLINKHLTPEPELAHLLKSTAIASIGPQTSKTCLELLGRVDIEAQEYTLEGLTTAIAARFS
ncbi:MAG: uroporphyrinogen-III synthase, partial [Microcystaceae cyanobacterium]